MTTMQLDRSWVTSIAIHFFLVAGALVMTLPRRSMTQLPFDVYEQPKLATQPRAIEARQAPQRPEPKQRAVFGANRRSMTDPTTKEGVEAKLGNTVAKEVDQEKLRTDDADSLPIPTEEYLVTSMPALVQEYRIPYPVEAKKKGIQGPVIMDLLIDAKGKVREAKLVSGPGSGLEEAALKAVQNFEFRPARVQDQAVAVRIRYSYRFVLER